MEQQRAQQPQGEVTSALEELDKSTEELYCLADDDLRNKLEFVLTPVQSQSASAKATETKEPEKSPAAKRICQVIKKIQTTTRVLRDVVERLDF